MYSEVSNASKAALITMSLKLKQLGFTIIDCQVYTEHLESLGAKGIERGDFIKRIKSGLEHETITGNWADMEIFSG